MNPADRLFDADYLVFSSHKTATRTIRTSLMASGFKCVHCHTLWNIQLLPGQFCSYLRKYEAIHSRKLVVISVFRDPLERLISSFFQALTKDVYAWTDPAKAAAVNKPEDSLIGNVDSAELERLFYTFCNKINGFGESIQTICDEMKVPVSDLFYSPQEIVCENHLDDCQLILMRFDLMIRDLQTLLERVTRSEINVKLGNISDEKWYAKEYRDFIGSLQMPVELIRSIYQRREQLMELFHPGEYSSIVDAKIRQYGHRQG
ncbi:MAG TPA: hypothetical protein VMO81_04230 [Aestuariivirgaceae bacterium]|nr:hypothetical protein [Aestuariivirgaceae bacterium]